MMDEQQKGPRLRGGSPEACSEQPGDAAGQGGWGSLEWAAGGLQRSLQKL